MFLSQHFAMAHTLVTDAEGIDPYAKNGVALTRDAASVVIAALMRDAYELDERGGEPNRAQADLNRKLARAMGTSLV